MTSRDEAVTVRRGVNHVGGLSDPLIVVEGVLHDEGVGVKRWLYIVVNHVVSVDFLGWSILNAFSMMTPC